MAAARWLLLQLADSAFPTGGFAHSSGLEAALQLGWVAHDAPAHRPSAEPTDGEGGRRADGPLVARSVEAFVEDAIWQAGDGALPLVRAGHAALATDSVPGIDDDGHAALAVVDGLADAFLTSHVASRASRMQGRAFIATAARAFPDPRLGALARAVRGVRLPGHFAPVFGAAAAILGLDVDDAAVVFLHVHVRGVLSAAVRLGVLGPHAAQRLQADLAPLLERVSIEASSIGLDDLAQTSPLLELAGTLQDRLYSRLFQS